MFLFAMEVPLRVAHNNMVTAGLCFEVSMIMVALELCFLSVLLSTIDSVLIVLHGEIGET